MIAQLYSCVCAAGVKSLWLSMVNGVTPCIHTLYWQYISSITLWYDACTIQLSVYSTSISEKHLHVQAANHTRYNLRQFLLNFNLV